MLSTPFAVLSMATMDEVKMSFEQIYALNEIDAELPQQCLMIGVERLLNRHPFYRVRAYLDEQEVPAGVLANPGWILPMLLKKAKIGASYEVDMTQFNGKWETRTFRKNGKEKPDGWVLVRSTYCGSHERRMVPSARMASEQFAALISIKRGNSPAAQEAARLHLVEGLTQSEAARVAGCSVQSAHNAIKVLMDRMEKCRIAAGFTQPRP